jgi:predicted alpha/beta superfamily hydrolase
MTKSADSPLLHSEVHFFSSAAVGAEFKILVGKVGFEEEEPPVVLYLTDADLHFGGAMDILRGLRWARYVPPVLVVGIGYRVNDAKETLLIRNRDLIPSGSNPFGDARGYPLGAGEHFLSFLQNELKPWVAQEFGVDPNESAYFGHSNGGLFGTFVLLTAPETFKRYGLCAGASYPGSNPTNLELEASYAVSHDDLVAKVYLNAGEFEDPEGYRLHRSWLPEGQRAKAEQDAKARDTEFGEWNEIGNMFKLVAALESRNYPSLILGSEVLSDECHSTVAPRSFSRSMRFLFDAPH